MGFPQPCLHSPAGSSIPPRADEKPHDLQPGCVAKLRQSFCCRIEIHSRYIAFALERVNHYSSYMVLVVQRVLQIEFPGVAKIPSSPVCHRAVARLWKPSICREFSTSSVQRLSP